jgi:UDP-glucose 4-epimerase
MMKDFYDHKTIAITGASGYIGKALSQKLTALGATVVRVSRTESTDDKDCIAGALDSSETWDRILKRADVVFHLAGQTSVYDCDAKPLSSLAANVAPTVCAQESAQKLGLKRKIVFASTATLYGLDPVLPVDENVSPNPISVYDLHKMLAEQQLRLASRMGILDCVSLRLANVYGLSPGQHSSLDRGVINRIAKLAASGEELKIYGTGDFVRDYIHLNDVVDAMIVCGATGGLGGLSLNVASGKGITISEAFSFIRDASLRLLGKGSRISFVAPPSGIHSIEFRSFIGNHDLLTSLTGWQPRTSFQQGIEELVIGF